MFTDESQHFRSPFRKPKLFRSLTSWANDFPSECMHLSLSLYFYLHLQTVRIQIRSECNSGNNVSPIKTFGHTIKSMQSIYTIERPTLSYKCRCAQEDASKTGGLTQIKIQRKPKQEILAAVYLSLSLSLTHPNTHTLRPAFKVCK